MYHDEHMCRGSELGPELDITPTIKSIVVDSRLVEHVDRARPEAVQTV